MSFNKLLVSTKFAPPRVGSRYIVRSHLLEALQRGKHAKLILVTGSAGFGKTILLAQWRQELMKAGLQVAWLSLSHDERLLLNFCTHVFDALARLGVPLDDEALLGSEGIASMDTLVAALVNGLATIDDDLYLILDDYHHVEDPLSHRLIQKLLEHGPGNLHLVITSRAVPPLSVARLRVMGQVSEIECGDLPFDLAETRAFLEQNVGGMRFSADEIGEIHDLTYGWPASLQLLAISLKNRPESRATLHSLASQSANLQNYLSEDVIARLPPPVAEFMESISISRRFNVALAEAITGNPQAGALLRMIEDENLLIMRAESEDRSPWFRFHPLFAEFLSTRLERRGTGVVHELHRRAGLWFAGKGFVVEAIRHATLGKDVAAAVDIIGRAAPTIWRINQLGPLLHLVTNLSPEDVASHPRLLYLGALTFAMTRRPARAEAWAAQLRASNPQGGPRATFRLALIQGLSALQHDDTAKALEVLEGVDIGDAGSDFERHLFVSTLATSLGAAGRYEDALRLLDAHPTTPDDDADDTALVMMGCRSVVLLLQGDVIRAEHTSNYYRTVAAQGHRSMSTSLSAAMLAALCYEQDRIDEARELLANRLHSVGSSSPEIMIRAVLCQARLDLLQDSADRACALLERQSNLFRSSGLDRAVVYMGAEQVRIRLAEADIPKANEILVKLEEIAAPLDKRSGFRTEISAIVQIARARVERARGDFAAALGQLELAHDTVAPLGRASILAVIHMLAASCLEAAGRGEEALARLTRAIQLGRQGGMIRTFLDEGEALHLHLQELRASGVLQGDDAAYVDDLLGRFDKGRPSRAAQGDAATKAPLTPREIEMVTLIAAGMSNKRIAQTLGITLETVKWNLKNVFVKLNVVNRYDASARARSQGLIR